MNNSSPHSWNNALGQIFSKKSKASKPATRKVEVEVERSFPKVNPERAKQAWLDCVWTEGGGLPTLVVKFKKDEDGLYTKRVLLPSMMHEQLTDYTSDPADDGSTKIEYKVTKWGLLTNDVVEDSHLGTVQFLPSQDGTTMVWNANFDVVHRYELWKRVSEYLISSASDNLKSYLGQIQVS